MTRTLSSTVVAALATASTAWLPSPASAAPPPSPSQAIQRACDAAGGLDTFEALGVLMVEIKRSEITTAGKTSSSMQRDYFQTPGPTPGRVEYFDSKVVAGDDGNEGWAITGGKADSRPQTAYMVKRILATTLFPVMLPFSLTWDGVTVTQVEPAEIDGTKVWRLAIVVPKGYFSSPQIATEWTVDLDRSTYAVVGASSPFTDLGKGLIADGMKFTWHSHTTVNGVTLPTEQAVVGLDAAGRERVHSRMDQLSYRVVPPEQATGIFSNPVPPDQRPKLPIGQAPEIGGQQPQPGTKTPPPGA